MAYIKLADGSTFQGLDEDVAKAVAAYATMKGNNDFNINDIGKIKISPEVTKIVEKVPVEVEKVVERMVAVPVLPERPLTKEEMEFIERTTHQAQKQKNINSAMGIFGGLLLIGLLVGTVYIVAKNEHIDI